MLNCVLDDRCNGLQTSVRLFVCLDKHQHLATVFFYHEVSCYGSIISPDSKTVSHSVTHFLLNSFPLPVSTHSHTCYSLFFKATVRVLQQTLSLTQCLVHLPHLFEISPTPLLSVPSSYSSFPASFVQHL